MVYMWPWAERSRPVGQQSLRSCNNQLVTLQLHQPYNQHDHHYSFPPASVVECIKSVLRVLSVCKCLSVSAFPTEHLIYGPKIWEGVHLYDMTSHHHGEFEGLWWGTQICCHADDCHTLRNPNNHLDYHRPQTTVSLFLQTFIVHFLVFSANPYWWEQTANVCSHQ